MLPAREIGPIWRDAPLDLIRFQDVAAMVAIGERPTMQNWLARLNAGLMIHRAGEPLAA